MEKYILALDQGTTSSRAILFNHAGQAIATDQMEFKQYYPQPGWVEHDAEEIWQSQLMVAKKCIEKAGIGAEQVAGIGITNQRETTVIWNKNTGKPLHHAIVWQDRRTSARCKQLAKQGWDTKIQEKTGLIVDSYFSATKVEWILKKYQINDTSDLLFGTIDSWIIWNLSQGSSHVTDISNASRTMLFNIHDQDWDQELMTLFSVPANMLPEVKSCSEIFAHTSLLGGNIPISGVAGDQQAALFGQMCVEKGMLKNTYGTGCFMVLNTGDKAITSQNKLLTTVAWKLDGQVSYALEGSIFVGGAIVQWLRDELKMIPNAPAVESLANQIEDSDGVYIVPAFTGLGAPHWNAEARGTILGLTRGSSSAHIARAALEAIAFQTMDVAQAMASDAGMEIKELRVDGGATANNLLMQLQSDILQKKVLRPSVLETTALGAAYFAGLAVGYWESVETIKKNWQVERAFEPGQSHGWRKQKIMGWMKAVQTALFWAEINQEEYNGGASGE